MNNSVRNFSAMNPCYFKKASGKPFLVTPSIVSKKNWNKGRTKHDDTCHAAAAVGKKARLGMK